MALRLAPRPKRVSPDDPSLSSDAPRPLPRRIGPVHLSMTSQPVLPAPSLWRVGIRIKTFEACSGLPCVAAGRIAQPPTAAFVARLQPSQLPSQTARQLPDSSTPIRVEPSSTRETRLQGAHRELFERTGKLSHENRESEKFLRDSVHDFDSYHNHVSSFPGLLLGTDAAQKRANSFANAGS